MIQLLIVCLIRFCTDLCFKLAVHDKDLSSFQKVWRTLVFSPYVYLGLLSGTINVIAWMFILRHFDLSYAYPFLSISYTLMIVFGYLIFDEHMDKYKLSGIAMIVIGALFLIAGA